MCDVVERIRNDGRAEGISEGILEGKADVIRKMLDANALIKYTPNGRHI